jgi:hypothetical protein
MTSTTTEMTTAPSRTPLLAAFGVAASAVLTAMGTFWDLTDNEEGSNHGAGDYFIVLGIIAVAVAIVYGLVVRNAGAGNPGRRAAILAVVSVLSIAVFWAGLPMVLVSGVVACALAEKDKLGSFGAGSKVGLALSVPVTAMAVWLAIAG